MGWFFEKIFRERKFLWSFFSWTRGKNIFCKYLPLLFRFFLLFCVFRVFLSQIHVDSGYILYFCIAEILERTLRDFKSYKRFWMELGLAKVEKSKFLNFKIFLLVAEIFLRTLRNGKEIIRNFVILKRDFALTVHYSSTRFKLFLSKRESRFYPTLLWRQTSNYLNYIETTHS